MEHILVYYEKL